MVLRDYSGTRPRRPSENRLPCLFRMIALRRKDEFWKYKARERVEHFETVRLRKGGVPLNISLTVSPIKDAKGRIVGASQIARDITDIRSWTRN